jgi:murein DD-endopeptidase MepM/ murein hydrolase activator NlpD
MSKRNLKFRLLNLHFAAVISASILFGCAFMLTPGEPAESNKIRVDIPVADQVAGLASESEKSANPSYVHNQLQTAASVERTNQMDSVTATTHPKTANFDDPADQFEPEAPALTWKHFNVKSGDSLYKLFIKAGLTPQQLAIMNASIRDKSWTHLFPGEELEFGFSDKQFEVLKIHRSRLEKWHIKALKSGGFELTKELVNPAIQLAYAEGIIDSSLFIDAKKAGMSDNITMELANIFGWDIDFILDIRKGDSFRLVYEEKYLGDERIGEGNIVSAQFINQGETFTAVRYQDSNNQTSYYTPAGDSMKKAFRRSPLDFARVSSHFNMKRKHPVLHKIRAHKGTDYAAGRGTPIKSTGDGKVIFAGRKGGYGNVVIIQHGQSISTLYAHMQRYAKGIRSGKRVSQGQVIGYVGSSGMATGPHLHYEFRVHGVHKNPLTVSLPKAQPIAKGELKRFQKQAEIAVAQLESYAAGFQIARSETTPATRDL